MNKNYIMNTQIENETRHYYQMLDDNQKKEFLAEALIQLKEKKKISDVLDIVYDTPHNVTYAYPVFKTKAANVKDAQDNREIDPKHKKDIKEQYLNGIGQIKEIPCLAVYDSKTDEITLIEGHHRRNVLEELDMDIYISFYKYGENVSKEETHSIMMSINKNSKKWTPQNTEQSLIRSKNMSYVLIDELAKQFPLYYVGVVRSCAIGWFPNSNNGLLRDIYYAGAAYLTEEDVKKAKERLNNFEPIREAIVNSTMLFEKGSGHKDRYINAGICVQEAVGKNFDVKHMINNIKALNSRKEPFAKATKDGKITYNLNFYQCVENFIKLYNKNKPVKRINSAQTINIIKSFHSIRYKKLDDMRKKANTDNKILCEQIRNDF